jgi:hypothetical protein
MSELKMLLWIVYIAAILLWWANGYFKNEDLLRFSTKKKPRFDIDCSSIVVFLSIGIVLLVYTLM